MSPYMCPGIQKQFDGREIFIRPTFGLVILCLERKELLMLQPYFLLHLQILHISKCTHEIEV